MVRRLPRVRGVGRIGAAVTRGIVSGLRSPIIRTRMRDGTELYLDVRSRSEVKSFWSGDYDIPGIRLLKNLLPPDGVMLDVGANIGLVTVAIAQYLRNQHAPGRVIAFEPVESNFARLRQNVEVNQLQNAVTLVNVGLGSERERVRISMEDMDGAETGNAVLLAGLLADDKKWRLSTIQIERLDDLAENLKLHRLDLIKADVEGAEVMFMRGAAKMIARFRPVLFGEFNSCFIQRFGHSVREAAEMLHPLGYHAFQVRKGCPWSLPEVHDGDMDVLFVPDEVPVERRIKAGFAV
jgi:FkbM family methyltransferase